MTEELKNGIQHLSQSDERLEDEVPIEEIFTEDFMLSCSEYFSIGQFFDDCGLVLEEDVVYKDIGSAELDAFVQANTSFKNWQEMFEAAVQNYENSGI